MRHMRLRALQTVALLLEKPRDRPSWLAPAAISIMCWLAQPSNQTTLTAQVIHLACALFAHKG